jgi:signal peptide peptidase SppA
MDLGRVRQHLMSRPAAGAAQSRPEVRTQARGGIAVVEIRGVLMQEAYYYDEIDMGQLAAQFGALQAEENITGVVLAFNSPGGMSAGMPRLVESLQALAAAKPVVGYVEHLCCSGAYWLACNCRQIVADKQTYSGSIGTRMLLYDWSAAFEQAGIEAVAIDTGKYKLMGAMGTKVTAEHREYLQGMVDTLQADFAAAVQQGRSLDAESYALVSDARLALTEEAISLGLVDREGTLADAIGVAAELADSAAKSNTKTKTKTSTKTSSKTRSQSMSEENTPQGPEAATMAQLKKEFPKASAEFLVEQLGAEATLTEAHRAYSEHLLAENAQLATQREEAEAKSRELEAEKAKNAGTHSTPPQKRGNTLVASEAGGEEAETTNYVAMAQQLAKEKSISFRAAAHEIKKRFPESRDAFIGPVLTG